MAQHLALVAIGLAGTFVAIGVSIVATISKPRMRYAYIFFALAVVMIFFFWLGWHIAPSLPPEEAALSETTGQNGGNWPFVMAGIGTLALAVVAFYIEIIRPWWNRPKFSLKFDNKEPYCREATVKLENMEPPYNVTLAYYIRIRVANIGKSVAKRCVAKLAEVADDSGKTSSGYDPWALHWVGTDWHEVPFSAIDLNQNEYEYFDVLYTIENEPELAIICKDESLRGINRWFTKGEYILQITVYGDNCKPVTQKYRLIWGAINYRDIRLEKM